MDGRSKARLMEGPHGMRQLLVDKRRGTELVCIYFPGVLFISELFNVVTVHLLQAILHANQGDIAATTMTTAT